MDGGGDEAIAGTDEAGAGDASSTTRRPAVPTPLNQKRYKKLGIAINPYPLQIVCQLNR
jgi:hypothetical protein